MFASKRLPPPSVGSSDPSAMLVEASTTTRRRRPCHPNHHITPDSSCCPEPRSKQDRMAADNCSEAAEGSAIMPKVASGHHHHIHNHLIPTSYERMSSPPTPSSSFSSAPQRQIQSTFIRSVAKRHQHHLAYKLLFILHLICAFNSFSSSSVAQVGQSSFTHFHTITLVHTHSRTLHCTKLIDCSNCSKI